MFAFIFHRIETHVQQTYQGNFTVSHIQSLETWLDTVVMGWIRLLYTSPASGLKTDEKTTKILETFRSRLHNHLYETCVFLVCNA